MSVIVILFSNKKIVYSLLINFQFNRNNYLVYYYYHSYTILVKDTSNN